MARQLHYESMMSTPLFEPVQYARCFDELQNGVRLMKWSKSQGFVSRVFAMKFHLEDARHGIFQMPNEPQLCSLTWRRPGMRVLQHKTKALSMARVDSICRERDDHGSFGGGEKSTNIVAMQYLCSRTKRVKKLRLLFKDAVEYELVTRCLLYACIASLRNYTSFNGAVARILLSKELDESLAEINNSLKLKSLAVTRSVESQPAQPPPQRESGPARPHFREGREDTAHEMPQERAPNARVAAVVRAGAAPIARGPLRDVSANVARSFASTPPKRAPKPPHWRESAHRYDHEDDYQRIFEKAEELQRKLNRLEDSPLRKRILVELDRGPIPRMGAFPIAQDALQRPTADQCRN